MAAAAAPTRAAVLMSGIPQRVQQRRGIKLPEGARSVARPHRWGNPFKIVPHRKNDPAVAAHAVALYRALVLDRVPVAELRQRTGPDIYVKPGDVVVPSIDDVRTNLRGRDLACYCKPGWPCHADVLLEIANG